MEIWKTTTESPLYEVSNKGNVRHIVRKQNLKLKSKFGYGVWARNEDGKIKNVTVHRTVYKAFIGDIPNGMVINHINFDKGCNELSNLEMVTQKENLQHSRKAGRYLEADKKHSIFMTGNTIKKQYIKQQNN